MTNQPIREALTEALRDFCRDGSFPDEAADAALSILSTALAERDARIAELEEALDTAASWLDLWGEHVGNCARGNVCTCGLTAVRADIARAKLRESERG